MEELYTIVLDVSGGTYVDQKSARSPDNAIKAWSGDPNPAVLSAFRILNVADFRSSVENALNQEGAITALRDVTSVWFTHLQVGEMSGFLNIIKTKAEG